MDLSYLDTDSHTYNFRRLIFIPGIVKQQERAERAESRFSDGLSLQFFRP